ncbi:hypothetical protein F5148DRAFT_978154 [Russula earlei]|uniref:Uncharacterized protein n=1 Tax=Russula earlei TaxID=71964 RepID=A0ACC0UDC7_9AGAM|nr:hypothetical protein F5148DRAFT_978154 [Russula earlei]
MCALVRESYREAEKVIWFQAVESPERGVILTGQPVSPGKSIFLWYLLICLLQDEQNVLFAVNPHNPILFYFDGVYLLVDPVHDNLPRNPKFSHPDTHLQTLYITLIGSSIEVQFSLTWSIGELMRGYKICGIYFFLGNVKFLVSD